MHIEILPGNQKDPERLTTPEWCTEGNISTSIGEINRI
jgi:hypothetical protein